MDEKFRVENYAIDLRVWPLHTRAERHIGVVHGRRTRTVVTDNRATLRRSVRFARGAQPDAVYVMRYATRGEGFVYPPASSSFRGRRGKPAAVANLAGPEHLCRYDDQGREVHLAFRPAGGRTYAMDFDVLRGFDAGSRDAHFHLFRPAEFAEVRVGLDLSPYLDSGFAVSDEPCLYYHPSDAGGHAACPRRGFGDLIGPSARDGRGRWRWELDGVEGGVVDLVWDVRPPDSWDPLPVAKPGLERLGPAPIRLAPELQIFHDVGKAARSITAEGGTYSLTKVRKVILPSKDEIRLSLTKVHKLFCLYYGTYGHPPHRTEPFVPEDPSRDVHESQKLFHLGPKAEDAGSSGLSGLPFRICDPHGWGPGI